MPGGRPRYYNSSQELEEVSDQYFKEKNRKNEPYTMSGLALFLGFSDKTMLYEYEKRPEFSHSIKQMRARIEEQINLSTARNECPPAYGIFMLKNFGWRDRIDHEVGEDTKEALKEYNLFKLSSKEEKNENKLENTGTTSEPIISIAEPSKEQSN